MPRGPKRHAQRNRGVDITVDDILIKALEDGPITVRDIAKRLERQVRDKLRKLRVRGVVLREGKGRPNREFTYRLLRPELAAEALREKGGGLARGATSNQKSASA
jgi:predicted ArsR family transcriptional regulator